MYKNQLDSFSPSSTRVENDWLLYHVVVDHTPYHVVVDHTPYHVVVDNTPYHVVMDHLPYHVNPELPLLPWTTPPTM